MFYCFLRIIGYGLDAPTFCEQFVRVPNLLNNQLVYGDPVLESMESYLRPDSYELVLEQSCIEYFTLNIIKQFLLTPLRHNHRPIPFKTLQF